MSDRHQSRPEWRAVYDAYINSEAWQAKRRQVFQHYGRQCSECGTKHGSIQVHHRTYERFGNESMGDLIPLCEDCHAKHHPHMQQQREIRQFSPHTATTYQFRTRLISMFFLAIAALTAMTIGIIGAIAFVSVMRTQPNSPARPVESVVSPRKQTPPAVVSVNPLPTTLPSSFGPWVVGKMRTFSGRVTTVNASTPKLVIRADFTDVECKLRPSQTNWLDRLKVGDKVKGEGIVESVDPTRSAITVKECEIDRRP